jgi:hypothetical protein
MVPRRSLTKHQLCANTHYMRGLGRGFRRAPRDAVRRAAGSRTGRARPPGGVSTFRHKPPPGGGRRVVEGFAIRIRTETPGSVDEREPTVTRFLARWTTRSAAASPTTRAVRPRRDRASLRVGPELSLRRGVQKRPCAGADSRSSSWPASVHGRSALDACRHARFQRARCRGYRAAWAGAAEARGVSRRTPSGRAD